MTFVKVNSKGLYGSTITAVIITSLLVAAFNVKPILGDGGGWWNTSWQYRKLVTIDHTKVEESLSNFPVMLCLNSSNFDFSKAQANLEDIRFTDYEGNPLSYEIEKPAAGGSYSYWSRVLVDNNLVYTDGAHNILPFDIDADGNLELVADSYRADSLQFYKYYGDPRNSSGWVRYVIDPKVGGGTGGSGAHYIAIGDINGDGRSDIVVAAHTQPEDVVAYLAPVNRLNMSAWQKLVLYADGTVTVYQCELGDIDGDGSLDVVVAPRDNNKLGWLRNIGAVNNWPVTWIDETITMPHMAHVGDLDHDGKNEIVCNYGSSAGETYILWYSYSGDPGNPANWVRHIMANLGTGSYLGAAESDLVDIDGDGNLDVVADNYEQSKMYLMRNPYPGNMSGLWPQYLICGSHHSRMSGYGDLDGDGNIDIVGADSWKNEVFWLDNPGNPFTPNWNAYTIDTSDTYLNWAHCATMGDIDKDGHLDVAVAAAGRDSSTGCTFQLYFNATFQPPPPPSVNEDVVWVKLPSISNVTDTSFYMYYGNPSAVDGQDPTNVWDSGCKMVQHLHETFGVHRDSTANANDGTPQSGLNQNATGKIDGADDFDGSNDYIDCGTNSSLEFGAGQDFALSAWIKADTFSDAVNYKFIFIKRFGTDNYYYEIVVDSNQKKLQLWMSSGTTVTVTNTQTLNTGQWYYVCLSVDRDAPSGAKLFVNLNPATADPRPASGSLGSGGHFEIGRSSLNAGCAYFDGIIDEARVSNVARSTAWIHAEYHNQNDPTTFYTMGTEEAQVSTNLYIDPSIVEKTRSDVSTTFKVNVTIQNVADLWGFDFNLTWDNTLITLVGVDFNTALDAIWGVNGSFMATNKTGPGYYQLAAVALTAGFTSAGTAPLATLQFHVENPPSNVDEQTPLHFGSHKLSDSHWSPISHTVEDGLYKITGKAPTLTMIPTSRTCRKYNETFTVKINVSDASNVEDFRFEIHYNATLLDVTDISWNAWGGTYTVDEVSGNLTGYASGSPISGNVTLLTITFNATYHHIWKDESTVSGWKNIQTGTIYFQWANLSYPTTADLRYERGGLNQINIGPDVVYTFSPIQGDIDNNGQVDVFDVRTVAAFYDIVNLDYNLTGDPIIDIYDLVVIGSNFGYTYGP
jgi:hypothetical protein